MELRGYKVEDQRVSNLGPSNDRLVNDDIAVYQSWWEDKKMLHSMQLHRTGLDGSFAFVAPESDVRTTLVLAAYCHGGGYPSAFRSFVHRPNEGRRGQVIEEGVSVRIGPGGVELDVDLTGKLEAAEILWDQAARENDHSPCAWKEARSAASVFPRHLHVEDQVLAIEPSPVEPRPNPWEPNPHYRNNRQTPDPTGSGMKIGAQSACWNYGQIGAGLWQENVAFCALFRKSDKDENILGMMKWFEKMTREAKILSSQRAQEVGKWWVVRAAVILGGIVLCLWWLCNKVFERDTMRGKQNVRGQMSEAPRLRDHLSRPRHTLGAIHDGGIKTSQTVRVHTHDETSISAWKRSESATQFMMPSAKHQQVNQGDREDKFATVFRALCGHAEGAEDMQDVHGGSFVLTRN